MKLLIEKCVKAPQALAGAATIELDIHFTWQAVTGKLNLLLTTSRASTYSAVSFWSAVLYGLLFEVSPIRSTDLAKSRGMLYVSFDRGLVHN